MGYFDLLVTQQQYYWNCFPLDSFPSLGSRTVAWTSCGIFLCSSYFLFDTACERAVLSCIKYGKTPTEISEFCLCKECAVPIYGHFSVQGLFFFINESGQLFFGCSDLLHNFTTSSELFILGIREKILSGTETCRNQIFLQQLGAEKQVLLVIYIVNTSVSFHPAYRLSFSVYC